MAFPALIAAMGVGGGLLKTGFGMSQARKAEDALNSYQRQDLSNVYENTSISTLGAKLQKEQQALRDAMAINAIAQGGARSMGALGMVSAASNSAYQSIAADLDRQFTNREFNIAKDNARIQAMMERREEQDIFGLGQQLNVGRQAMFDGIGDIAYAGMMLGNTIDFGGFTPQVDSVGSLTAEGFDPITTPFDPLAGMTGAMAQPL